MNQQNNVQLATRGGGCFWCTEAVFTRLQGVEKVESGYSGGTVPNPTYREVCSGLTGHTEVAPMTQTIRYAHLGACRKSRVRVLRRARRQARARKNGQHRRRGLARDWIRVG